MQPNAYGMRIPIRRMASRVLEGVLWPRMADRMPELVCTMTLSAFSKASKCFHQIGVEAHDISTLVAVVHEPQECCSVSSGSAQQRGTNRRNKPEVPMEGAKRENGS